MFKLSPDIPYQHRIAFASFFYENEKYNIFFQKGYGEKVDEEYIPSLSRYYIQIYKDKIEGEFPTLCAYIYFYLDFKTKETKYIGTGVNPEFRNKGFASILASLWIWICMDNNFYEYLTNKKQRKPFLIYLLKLYGFEIKDITEYDTSRKTILICKDILSQDKCLYFKNAKQEIDFRNSHIYKNDNYRIISSLDNISILDRVLLSTPYKLEDFNQAYVRSRRVLENKNII